MKIIDITSYLNSSVFTNDTFTQPKPKLRNTQAPSFVYFHLIFSELKNAVD